MCYYLSKVAQIEFKLWDIGTVTAGDFTVEYQIPRALYDAWEGKRTDRTKPEGTEFEDYLKAAFEDIVSKEKSVLNPTEDPPSKVKIANITFAFNNAKLIKLLQARGAHAAEGRFD